MDVLVEPFFANARPISQTELVVTLEGGHLVECLVQVTYVVHRDCTGSMTLYVSPLNITVNADFVIDADGSELRVILTDPGVVESRIYKRQSPQGRKD